MLIRTVSGSNRVFDFYGPQAEIDPTNPETRKYVWQRLKENYVDNGVDLLWFDEAEPEIHPEHFDNLILSLGNGDEVGLIYPYYYAQLVYDGMKEMGRDDIVTLSRCAYIGAQKFGTLVWSGDIPSTFESLRKQIKSGLNMAMCGIPWWTTDIGGFYGGDIESDEFRELIVRWFQYGVFCPVFRLHGSRNGHDRTRDIIEPSGGDNELWSFGDRDYEILRDLVFPARAPAPLHPRSDGHRLQGRRAGHAPAALRLAGRRDLHLHRRRVPLRRRHPLRAHREPGRDEPPRLSAGRRMGLRPRRQGVCRRPVDHLHG